MWNASMDYIDTVREGRGAYLKEDSAPRFQENRDLGVGALEAKVV